VNLICLFILQNLAGILLTGEISKAKLSGAELKSSEVTILPNQLNSGEYKADTRTAGSIILLVQVSLPCLIFGKEESKLYLKGGTNAEHAPQIGLNHQADLHFFLIFKNS
jgi:RNA 3'-terminal phosphate cyclase (ATP)